MTDHHLRLRFAEADPSSVRFICTCGGWELPVRPQSGSHCEVTPQASKDAHLLWATQHVAPPETWGPA